MLDALRNRLATVSDVRAAAAVLEWDQETYMPPAAAEARAQQLTTLKTLAHEHFTADETARLLEDAEASAPEDEPTRALLRITRRDFDRATRRPSDLVARQALAKARGLEAWKRARETDDFQAFASLLAETVALAHEEAEALGYEAHPYDALLEEYEPGATHAEIARTFAALRAELVPLVEAISEAEPVDDAALRRAYDPDRQWAFGMGVAERMGYDLGRGRQDRSAHPFTTAFTPPYDVRITTRLDPDFFPSAFFGTLHEVGHALYEQGFDPALARTPLADGTSLGVHESQSRLWENLVGRSRDFWQWAYPLARDAFPDVLAETSEEAFYRAVNRVEPSLIRVEADEVTYSLHVMLRFELETALLTGDLAVRDLPAAWNDAMQAYLGLTPPSDADGVLQDIHWALGAIGYFPTYALGSLMSVQLWEAADRDLGGLEGQVSRGEFGPLLGWLREHVHRHGRALPAGDLLERATGQPLSAEPWLAYARRKYGAIYGL
jgi:carboxypeptidase Taq